MGTRAEVSVAPKTPSRSTSRRKAPAAGDAAVEELTSAVDRVLKVSEPVPQPAAPRTARARTARTVEKEKGDAKEVKDIPSVRRANGISRPDGQAAVAVSAKTLAPAARAVTKKPRPAVKEDKDTKAPTSATAGPSRSQPNVATKTRTPRVAATSRPGASAASRIAASAPSATQPEPPEWANASSDMSVDERRRLTMTAMNTTHGALSMAWRTGYKCPGEAALPEGVTLNQVKDNMKICALSLKVMREMDDKKQLLVRSSDVEKAAIALVQRYIVFDMLESATKAHAVARRRLMDICCVTDEDDTALPSTSRPYPQVCEDIASREWRMNLVQLILYGWLCAAGSESAGDLQQLPYPSPDRTLRHAHPFHVALHLPAVMVSPTMVIFYRDLTKIHPARPDWLHMQLLSLQAFALACTASPPPEKAYAYDPPLLWKHTSVLANARLKSGGDAIVEANELVKGVVLWADVIIQKRCEEREQWFSGEKWVALMDLWISLGKKLGRVNIVEDALSRMMSASKVSSSSPTPEMSQSVTRPTEKVPPTEPNKRRVQGVADAICFNAQLSSLAVLLSNHLGEPTDLTGPAVVSSIKTVNMPALCDALSSIPADSEGLATLDKVIRTLEQVRRSCRRLLPAVPNEEDQTADPLTVAVREWLVTYLDVAEEFMQSTFIRHGLIHESLKDITTPVQTLSLGAVDVTLVISRLITDTPEGISNILAYFERAVWILSLARSALDQQSYVDSTRVMVSNAYNRAVPLYNAQRFTETASLGRFGYDAATAALEYTKNAKEETVVTAIGALEPRRAKAAELAAIVAQKTNDQEALAVWYGRALAATPHQVLAQVVARLGSDIGRSAIDAGSDLAVQITRVAGSLRAGAASYVSIDSLQPLLAARPLHDEALPAYANILEKVADDLRASSAGSREAAVLAQAMYRQSEAIFNERPLLIVKSIQRQISLKLEYDVDATALEELFQRGESCAENLSHDTPIAIKTEIMAAFDILRCLSAYRIEADSKLSVARHAASAIHRFQGLLLPVTEPPQQSPSKAVAPRSRAPPVSRQPKQPLNRTSTTSEGSAARTSRRTVSDKLKTTPKTPAKPTRSPSGQQLSVTASPSASRATAAPAVSQWLDLPYLIELLTGLVALLGMMGMGMQRVEALKLVRAMLRGHEDVQTKVAYIRFTGHLADEYIALGKYGRAKVILEHAVKLADGFNSPDGDGLRARLEIGLRWCAFLAQSGRVDEAKAEYEELLRRIVDLDTEPKGSFVSRAIVRSGDYERAALAHYALTAIRQAEGDPAAALQHLQAAWRNTCRRSDAISKISLCRLDAADPAGSEAPSSSTANGSESVPAVGVSLDDPFSAPAHKANDTETKAANGAGADEKSKDEKQRSEMPAIVRYWYGKHMGIRQMESTMDLFNAAFALNDALAERGSAPDVEYYMESVLALAKTLKVPIMASRSESRMAALSLRMRKYEVTEKNLADARAGISGIEGPEAIHANVLSGDLLRKQAEQGAVDAFLKSGQEIQKLEEGFLAKDGTLVTPRKASAAGASTTPRSSRANKDHLLPSVLAHVLRQRILLASRKSNAVEEDGIEILMKRIKDLNGGAHTAPDMLLQGQLALIDVLKAFKADLFTSSLAESTIAMPMSSLSVKAAPRSTTRTSAHALLARAEAAFSDALSLGSIGGRPEDIREASLCLAMLHAFQSSLGHGAADGTRLAADLLASTSAITLHRELQETIRTKFVDGPGDNLKWPLLSSTSVNTGSGSNIEEEVPYRQYWSSIRPPLSVPEPVDLSPLPPSWAVVSISISDDQTSMFVTRHQQHSAPVIFCLPFGRQGKREVGDEDEGLPFAMAKEELLDIIATSDSTSRNAKHVATAEGRREWWSTRYGLDVRLKELLEGMEEYWFGAFKAILSSQVGVTDQITANLGAKLSKVFNAALQIGGVDMRKASTVKLDDAVLRCFATLPASTSEAQLEDLVYFILDMYGFHGVPVAIEELDVEQIIVDIKDALSEISTEGKSCPTPFDGTDNGHLFLILDKHTQCFPWESMPCLRGRSISRVPSLPFLMDQIRLAKIVSCNNKEQNSPPSPMLFPLNGTNGIPSASDSVPSAELNTPSNVALPIDEGSKLGINARKVYYIVNPSGDLASTQTHFESWMTGMHAAGWHGVAGRELTELEMTSALSNHDLVLYFGHGGAEQYIRSHKLKSLQKCAATMLWGCSSGTLKEQGDMDVTGGAYNYLMAGCPSLVAMLWDVTDKDIDRLSSEVLHRLHLDPTHLAVAQNGSTTSSRLNSLTSKSASTSSKGSTSVRSGVISGEPGILPLAPVSITEAVNASREECKMKYLTGAAPVVYGLPMWMF